MSDDAASVMLIGHNPAVEQLAITLARSGEKVAIIERKYPTGALATPEFNGSWRELRPGSAELTDFVTPKDLARH